MPKMQFGKYAGQDFSEIPQEYFEWIIRNSEEKILEAKAEIERRKLKVENSVMAKIVSEGFAVAVVGIDAAEKAKLELARDRLMEAIREAAQPKGA